MEYSREVSQLLSPLIRRVQSSRQQCPFCSLNYLWSIQVPIHCFSINACLSSITWVQDMYYFNLFTITLMALCLFIVYLHQHIQQKSSLSLDSLYYFNFSLPHPPYGYSPSPQTIQGSLSSNTIIIRMKKLNKLLQCSLIMNLTHVHAQLLPTLFQPGGQRPPRPR